MFKGRVITCRAVEADLPGIVVATCKKRSAASCLVHKIASNRVEFFIITWPKLLTPLAAAIGD
jgi:hypothetical protein